MSGCGVGAVFISGVRIFLWSKKKVKKTLQKTCKKVVIKNSFYSFACKKGMKVQGRMRA